MANKCIVGAGVTNEPLLAFGVPYKPAFATPACQSQKWSQAGALFKACNLPDKR